MVKFYTYLKKYYFKCLFLVIFNKIFCEQTRHLNNSAEIHKICASKDWKIINRSIKATL